MKVKHFRIMQIGTSLPENENTLSVMDTVLDRHKFLLGLPFVAPTPVISKWPRHSVPHSMRRRWTEGTSIAVFFIPLPEPLDVPHLYEVPIEGVLDPRDEFPCVSLGMLRGVEHAFRLKVRFHQSEQESSDPSLAALMSALEGGTRGASAAVRRPVAMTVAEVWGPMPEASQDAMTIAFDEALSALRSIQRAHHLVTARPLRLATRKGLPAASPILLSSGDIFAKPVMQLFMVNRGEREENQVRGQELSRGQLSALGRAFSDYGPNIFTAFSDMRREANIAFKRGENLSAIILAGAAAEALLVEIMLLMMWEEDLPFPAVARVLTTKDTISKKVTSQFSGRLGGQWGLDKPGPVRDWRINLADLRNRAVHGGYIPDDRELQIAFEALEGLEHHLGDRLVANMRHYPGTTQIFLGPGGLDRRRKVATFKTMLERDESYLPPDPGAYFRRWKQHVESNRAGRQVGCVEKAELFVVKYPTGVSRWFIQDHACGLAAQIPKPELAPQLAHQLAKVLARPVRMPISISAQGATCAVANTALSWVPVGEVNPVHPYRRWEVCLVPPALVENPDA